MRGNGEARIHCGSAGASRRPRRIVKANWAPSVNAAASRPCLTWSVIRAGAQPELNAVTSVWWFERVFLAAEKEEWAREPWLKGNGSTLIVHQSRLVFRGVGARLQRCWLTARSYTDAPALLRMTGQTLSLSWRRPKAVSLGHCGQQARCYRKSDWICECGGGWLGVCTRFLLDVLHCSPWQHVSWSPLYEFDLNVTFWQMTTVCRCYFRVAVQEVF